MVALKLRYPLFQEKKLLPQFWGSNLGCDHSAWLLQVAAEEKGWSQMTESRYLESY